MGGRNQEEHLAVMSDHIASPLYGHPAKLPAYRSVVLKTRRTFRSRQLVTLIALFSVAFCLFYWLRTPTYVKPKPPKKHPEPKPEAQNPGAGAHDSSSSHPIWQLTKEAEKDFQGILARQSKSLPEAVEEYRRRYGIAPPPHFDKWFSFAKEKDVQLIDEYDSIYETLTPFWGLSPATIRGRVQEAQGFGNNLLNVMIRNGEVTKAEGGGEWLEENVPGMMKSFLEHLPDMDLCFNIHDEPRVIVPYEDLSRLVDKAMKDALPAAKAITAPRNSWSQRPLDVNDGKHFEEIKTTRFNTFAHQPTWSHSRMSCAPDTPSRVIDDSPAKDNFESYSISELGFIYNQTAFTDICQSPSFGETHGFFDRPNAYNIVQDLFRSSLSPKYPPIQIFSSHLPGIGLERCRMTKIEILNGKKRPMRYIGEGPPLEALVEMEAGGASIDNILSRKPMPKIKQRSLRSTQKGRM